MRVVLITNTDINTDSMTTNPPTGPAMSISMGTSFTKQQLRHLARLARIGVTDAQAEQYAEQLSSIIGLVAQMDRINTDAITPMSHPQDMVLRLRDDVVTATDCRAAYQALAPEAEDGLYLVPRVIE